MLKIVRWCTATGRPRIAEDEIHVWRAKLDFDIGTLEDLAAILSPAEKIRAERFVLTKDRQRFSASRGILRKLLGDYLGESPRSLDIGIGPYGKPFLHAAGNTNFLRFNLSRSHGLALIAISLRREVGIDVEKINPKIASEKIEDRFFSHQEQRELNELPAELRSEGFFLHWTCKEAYVKARGEGLQIALNSFHVSYASGQSAALGTTDREKWSLFSFCPEPGFAAALVVEGQGVLPRYWEWRNVSY
jgi:4'-phosphopantetheinyl transferase